jgi:hypothetical protein
MTQITVTHGVTTGISDDGRIVFTPTDSSGWLTIDGRWACRGYYAKMTGDAMIAHIDPDAPVDPADWAAACEVISAVFAEQERRHDEMIFGTPEQQARKAEATAVLNAIPVAARAELAAVNARLRKHFSGLNEGGEGYVYQADWRSREGREILGKYGVDADAVAAASQILKD